ncbi:Serine aminopeptidase, S33 [uncultured archaeon]|nr:Serine aminopeptidase, S33 [uncultured archaeon]
MQRTRAGLLAACIITAMLAAALIFSGTWSASGDKDWKVTDDGLLEYSVVMPQYQAVPPEDDSNSSLTPVSFSSRGQMIEGLLRIPSQGAQIKGAGNGSISIPGIVLLGGASVTKEREQVLAKYLAELGYASLALDQRNLGGIDPQGDLQLFLKGMEPTEHKMVYDALAAAQILRQQLAIDPENIIYAGESNGGRFALIACALDPRARGVLAISTCGYGADAAITSGRLTDPMMIRFYRSIDPETYMGKISPRMLVMIHSRNDTVIPYEDAKQTFDHAASPRSWHEVGCTQHGYCREMNAFIEDELGKMVS